VVVEWKKATEDVATLEEARKFIVSLGEELDRLGRENESLRQRIDRLSRHIFGRKSEKGVPEGQAQLPFINSAAGEVSAQASDEDAGQGEAAEVVEVTVKRKKHRGRRALPEDLPRERKEIEPRPEDLECRQCASAKVRIREEVTEGLDYNPASLVIREYVRGVYACPCCEGEVSQPPLPARPIEKGRPEPGLLAQVVTSKYADHLPLYRQEQIFARHGLEVSRRTLAEWNGAVADLLKPIVLEAMKPELFSSPWIQSDDTTVDVQVDDRKPQIRKGHMWVYRGNGGDVIYDFTWVRNRDGPMGMLAGYRGYLQADAAPAYDDVYATYGEITEVGCWAHCRRYFKEAVSSSPVGAVQILTLIRELYAIERAAAQVSVEERKQLRQRHSVSVLQRIEAKCRELQHSVLPKSPLAEAIGYALRNWQALRRYVEDGRLKIDNNGAERAIKPLVIGRKNWLFVGSEAAAHRTAVLLSLVQTCKHLGIDPFVYLRDVIERVSTHPMSRIGELTPRQWKQLRAEVNATKAAA
jgi:transposase